MNFEDNAKQIANILKNIPKFWDGRTAILEMKERNFPHWKQMEWIGFYFQYLCENNLSDIMGLPGPRYGNVSFDGLKDIPWDFKAHAMNTSSHEIIVNDSDATAIAIKEYGAVGLILAVGEVVYNDENRTFQSWHDKLKGGMSSYVRERIERGAWSRLRKVSFNLQQITFVELTDSTLVKCGSFQSDFRNADGSPRRAKVLINLEKLEEEIKYCIEWKAS